MVSMVGEYEYGERIYTSVFLVVFLFLRSIHLNDFQIKILNIILLIFLSLLFYGLSFNENYLNDCLNDITI